MDGIKEMAGQVGEDLSVPGSPTVAVLVFLAIDLACLKS
jgi:hypothetical protein